MEGVRAIESNGDRERHATPRVQPDCRPGSPPGRPGRPDRGRGLDLLPQPLHLYAFLTESRHFHLGRFEDPRDTLRSALDRTAVTGLEHLPRSARILDIGCGLGGTTLELAARGFDVFGVDPCRACVDYALWGKDAVPSARFAVATIAEVVAGEPAGFGALVMIEVLQFFPALRDLVESWRVLLADGVVVVVDLATTRDLDWNRVPFHRTGSIERAAREGFEVIELRDLTASVQPTTERLIEKVTAERAALLRVFGSRPCIEREIAELRAQLHHLQVGLESGDLRYEFTAFRRRR